MIFNDENILKVFGNEAAENEDPANLKGYYFKNRVFDQVTSKVPLRIVVGHKGIGKSALFTVARLEDDEKGIVSVVIKPDDIISLTKEDDNFLRLIRNWKDGLREIIFNKIVQQFQTKDPSYRSIANVTGHVITLALSSIRAVDKHLDLNDARRRVLSKLNETNEVNVYVDDLDRGWEGKQSDIRRISALLNAVRDLSTENRGLYFKISLRSDVYFLVRTSDESTDKIEGSVVWHSWTNHEILALLVKRIDNFWGRPSLESELIKRTQKELAMTLNSIMEPHYFGKGKWERIATYRMLMSLIRRRPRDLVKLCTMAAKQAYIAGDTTLGTSHFSAVFDQYSQERLQDTINEFRSELPSIEQLLLNMKPSRKEKERGVLYKYSTAELLDKIREILGRHPMRFASGRPADEKNVAHFLYKIILPYRTESLSRRHY